MSILENDLNYGEYLKNDPLSIQIIPIGAVNRNILEFLLENLSKVLPPIVNKVKLGEKLKIPSKAHNSERDQYGAEALLRYSETEISKSDDEKTY